MDPKQIAKNTAKTLISYLTYQAVRTVVGQLSETDPPTAIWLNGFSSAGKIQNGEAYLEELMKARQDLAFRIMTVRQYLAEEVVDYLPEMARTGIQQANMEHRRLYLERMTQLQPTSPLGQPEEPPPSSPSLEDASENSESS